MGLLDHRRTFRFRLEATPEQCVDAFLGSFSGRASKNVLIKAKWKTRRTGKGAVATYAGRAGVVVGAVTAMSDHAQAEHQSALGSAVEFEIEEVSGGVVTCAMWMSSGGSGMFGTRSDARFIRPYMQTVQKRLREVDASLSTVKS